MSYSTIIQSQDDRGVTTITFNRPDVLNAINDQLIEETHRAVTTINDTPGTRAVVFTGAGKGFSAGADLNWMRRMAGYSEQENTADAMKLAEMLRAVDECSKPTIALVNGAAMGGGVGLVAVCDMAIAAQQAFFALSEARLGLIPATISPFVVRAVGSRSARRYFLTAERFDATTAQELGLVDEVVDRNDLQKAAERRIENILKGGPVAQEEAKKLIRFVAERAVDNEVCRETAKWIARTRASEEGQEGMRAFLEKRQPAWTKDV